MSRALVVWCPDWPVTAVGIDAVTPGAVLEAERVAACTAAARAMGVRRGQRLRDAQRRCPELEIAERDVDAEGRLFETVVAAVAALTPRVEVVRPGVCAVPARGAARYYGGEESLRILVQDRVVECGHDCGVGIADGLFTAELAARPRLGDRGGGGCVVPVGGSAEFLAPYPLTVLERPELADLLVRLGITSLGGFAALAAADVADRFGVDGALAHRLARGLEPRPVAPRAPVADLAVRTAFDPPAGRSDQVIFAAKSLADRLHAGLAGAGLACVRLAVTVTFDDGEVQERLWRHDGLLSATAVAERVRWQLSNWRPADAGAAEGRAYGGVVLLEFVPDQLVIDTGRQHALWGDSEVTERVERAAERIQAMLGHRSVTRPYLVGGRGPGEQVVRVPVGDLPPRDLPDGPWPTAVPEPGPAVVLPTPSPATVTGADGLPVQLSIRCVPSQPPAEISVDDRPAPVVAWSGPWPARERWWDPAHARRRAHFQLVTPTAAYLLAFENGGWNTEAVYD